MRLDKWEEFKRLVNETKPEAIVYNIEHAGISTSKTREFTCLRLIIPAKSYYVYVDFPKGDKLRETGIPIHEDSTGTRSIEDQDIKEFLRKEFGEKLAIYSYWVT